MKALTGLLLSTLFISPAFSQDTEEPAPINKNSVQGTTGTMLVFFTANVNYERMVKELPKSYLSVKAGFGGYASWNSSGQTYSLSLVHLAGKKNNHLESGAGLIYLHEKGWESQLWPDLHIGYRYQKPDGELLFRTGLGFPEGLYLGAGFAF